MVPGAETSFTPEDDPAVPLPLLVAAPEDGPTWSRSENESESFDRTAPESTSQSTTSPSASPEAILEE